MSPRFTLLSKYTHTPLEDSTALQPKVSYVTLYYDSPTRRRALYQKNTSFSGIICHLSPLSERGEETSTARNLSWEKNLNRQTAETAPAHSKSPPRPANPGGCAPVLHLILCPDRPAGHGGGQADTEPVPGIFSGFLRNPDPALPIDAGNPRGDLAQ